jgi:negative regulator of sigma E activity
MSDYLWDKSGEPEAEVERLEELLGRLRHTRGAPELPHEVETHASTRAGLFSNGWLSRPARLAAAAALLLAVLAGALVALRTFKTYGGRASVHNETQAVQPKAAGAPEETRTPEETRAPEVAASPSKEFAKPEKSQRETTPRDVLAVERTFPKPQRREPVPRESVASESPRRVFKPALVRGEGFDGGAPDVERRVRAKEQLVYALRLTSEALKEVRGRASGVEVHANAFDGRSPLR